MHIQLNQVLPDGSVYEGEEPGSILELENDPLARARGPVGYSLNANVTSDQLVVTGRLWAELGLLCGRCGHFSSTRIEVSSFLRAYSLSQRIEAVDVTPDIREDILVALPSFSVCSWKGESGVCPESGVDIDALKRDTVDADDDRWDALKNLQAE